MISARWDEIPNKTFQLRKIIPSRSEITDTPDVADISRAQATDTEDEDSQQDHGAKICHGTAVKLFDQCLLWLQQQEEVSLYDVDSIRELWDFAARKRINSFKQKKLSDYFKQSYS